MATTQPDNRLGTQLWLEQTDSARRVDELVSKAASLGIGQLRIFLMWPWIQEHSQDEWDFALFDAAFDAAAAHGLKIKATLTANSGPWWLGTPSVLHTHTVQLSPDWAEPADAYVTASVQRYREHPALGQWILWNEPFYAFTPFDAPAFRPEGAERQWAEGLRVRYDDDLARLNRRWRTGYSSFEEVPFPEEIAHPAHRGSHWQSFAPVIDDFHFRAERLEGELRRIREVVRAQDDKTPLCINPSQTFNNHAEYGYRMSELASIVDVLGASFHAPWSFSFAEHSDYTPLVAAGLSLLSHTPGEHRVEVTEVQTGNTYYAGVTPGGVGSSEIAATYLAPLFAGAESVTGWCFNTRSQDFEAGEWALLDDSDEIGPRALALPKIRSLLAELDDRLGSWAPQSHQALVVTSEDSQAVQLAIAQSSRNAVGSGVGTAARGAALVTVELGRLGINAGMAPASALSQATAAALIVVSHVAAWDSRLADQILDRANDGVTVLIDGTSGEFDLDSAVHRPWPGEIAERIGLRSTGLDTSHAAAPTGRARLDGYPYGVLAGVHSSPLVTDVAWTADTSLISEDTSLPILWERSWGSGRLLFSTAPLSATLVIPGVDRSAVAYILRRATEHIVQSLLPTSAQTMVIPIVGDLGSAVGVFAPTVALRSGKPVSLSLPPGMYFDLWTGVSHLVGQGRSLLLDCPDGIAVIIPELD